MTTQFPGLDQRFINLIQQRIKNIPEQFKLQAQQLMYSDYYQQQKREKDQAERQEYKNQIMQKTIKSKNSDEKVVTNANIKIANLADMIRNKYHIDLTAGDDTKIVNNFVDQLPDGNKLLLDYINGKNSKLLTKSGLIQNETFNKLAAINEKNTVSAQLNVNNAAVKSKNQEIANKTKETSLKSSSHFDDDNYASNFLAKQGPERSDFIDGARNQGYIDGEIASVINAKQTYERLQMEEAQRQKDYKNRGFGDKAEETNVGIAQGFVNFFANAYNNLFANNPSIGLTHTHNIDMDKINFADDLLGGNNIGDLRANSGWSKAGNVGGELIANIALMRMMPNIGGNAGFTSESISQAAARNGWKGVVGEITDRALVGAAEGGEFGILATMGQENPQENLNTNLSAGMILGGLFGIGQGGIQTYKTWKGLSKELAEAGKKNTINGLNDAYNRAIRPSSRGVKSSTQLEKYNSDVIDAVELITKNKNNLRFIDTNGEEIIGQLPKTVDQFGQAIKQTQKDLYSSWSAMVKEAGKSADVDTTNVIKALKKLKNDKEWLAGQNQSTLNEIDKWIADLEGLNNKMSIEGVQQKTQELNDELSAFFKSNNPNDVGPNSIKALVNKELKKGIDDAIDGAGLNSDSYQDLKRAYSALKTIESDVNHRAVVFGRQNPQSLVDSMADLSSVDAIASFLKDPGHSITKLVGSQLEKAITRGKNNPNKMIEKLFNKADNTISKSSNSSLKTAAQQEQELSARATSKQKDKVTSQREERLQQRQRLKERIESIKQENEARYQEYLRSKGVGSETQALPQREGVNNYNTIIADNGTPTAVTPEGTAVRQGGIAESPTQNINYIRQSLKDAGVSDAQIENVIKELEAKNVKQGSLFENNIAETEQDIINKYKNIARERFGIEGDKVDINVLMSDDMKKLQQEMQKEIDALGKKSGNIKNINYNGSNDVRLNFDTKGEGFSKLRSKKADYMIASAENPMGKQATAEFNERATQEFRNFLDENGIKWKAQKGMYNQPENSQIIAIDNPKQRALIDKRLAQHAPQNENIIVKNGYAYRYDPRTNKAYKVDLRKADLNLPRDTKNYYSEVDGNKYQLPLYGDLEKPITIEEILSIYNS